MAGSGGGVPEAVLSGAAQQSSGTRRPIEVITEWGAEHDFRHPDPHILSLVTENFSVKRGRLLEAGAAVVMPGKLGTLAEAVAALDQIGLDLFTDKEPMPVIFVGREWQRRVADWLAQLMPASVMEHISFAATVEEVPVLLGRLLL